MIKRIDKSLGRLEKLQEAIDPQKSGDTHNAGNKSNPDKVTVYNNANQNTITAKHSVNDTPPANYKEKMMSTKGRLSIPAVIHVRDYMGLDAMELSMTNDEDFLEQLLKVVKKMVWEDIDPYTLHQKELEEIMLFVYGTNWDTVLQNYEYIPTEEEWEGMTEELQKRYTDGESNYSCNIAIDKIESIPISNDFSEPFEYEKDGTTYRFRLPRIGDSLTAVKYANKVFNNDREDLMPLILADKRGENLEEYISGKDGNKVPKFPVKELTRYYEFANKYLALIKKATQSQFILSVGDCKPDNMEKHIEMVDEIPSKVWIEFIKDMSNVDFGISPNVEVLSPISRKPVTRRFRFQFMDLLPSLQL